MKLSRLYSNRFDTFSPIAFNEALNVVLAEIRLPENKDKDTHNLGKTTLGRLLDFCFLLQADKEFFLLKHEATFKDFVFFLEIELLDKTYVTVRRGVEQPSKISLKKHEERHQDFSSLGESNWDHFEMPFERAKDLLDGILDLRALNPWSFRKGLGYLIRSQDDYKDVFRLGKYSGAHSDWKPYLAHILGFNGDLVRDHYEKEDEISKKEATAETIKRELGGSVQDLSKIEGMLLLKEKEREKKQQLLDAFDFRAQDKQKTKELVENLDERIANLNAERYSLTQNRKKILVSLDEDQFLFNIDEAQELFHEVGVLFEGQIKRDFGQLLEFNKAITEERRGYLQEEKIETEKQLTRIGSELNEFGKRRSEAISFLGTTDVFSKYKKVTDEVVTLRADITSLQRQKSFLHRLQELRAEIRSLTEEKRTLQSQIEADVEAQNASPSTSLFSSIRIFFSEIVEEVISRKALLSVSPNQLGHLEFKAEILDESGNRTSADLGNTYRKLLCIAFDLALLRAHLNERFPRFVYHDGVFEALDDRKKENLLEVIHKYGEFGIQHVITLIDSDLPPRIEGLPSVFQQDEVVLFLHDVDEQGRLFKIPAW